MELNDSNLEIFRSDVRHIAQIDKLINEAKELMKPLQDRIKQLNLERKDLEQELCSTMDVNNLKQAELPDKTGILEYQVKQATVPITQKTIKEKMIIFYEEADGSKLSFNSKSAKEKGNAIHNYIYGKENRDFVKKECIKTKKKN